jgi:hypothetical protein
MEELMNTAVKTLATAMVSLGLVAGSPTVAEAHPAVAVGWAVAAGVGGLVVGYLFGSHSFLQPAEAAPTLQPGQLAPGCYWSRARIGGVWHRVQVCD